MAEYLVFILRHFHSSSSIRGFEYSSFEEGEKELYAGRPLGEKFSQHNGNNADLMQAAEMVFGNPLYRLWVKEFGIPSNAQALTFIDRDAKEQWQIIKLLHNAFSQRHGISYKLNHWYSREKPQEAGLTLNNLVRRMLGVPFAALQDEMKTSHLL